MAGSPVIRNDSYRIAIRQQGAIHAQPAAVENGTREGGQMPASAEEPELDMDTPLAELRAAVEIRKHRQTIEASGLYSDEEIPEDLARLRLLTEKVEEAEEKARLLAYLAEADKKSMIRPDPHCKVSTRVCALLLRRTLICTAACHNRRCFPTFLLLPSQARLGL